MLYLVWAPHPQTQRQGFYCKLFIWGLILENIRKGVGKTDKKGKEINKRIHFIKQITTVGSWGSVLQGSFGDCAEHTPELSRLRGQGAGAFTFRLPSIPGWGVLPGVISSRALLIYPHTCQASPGGQSQVQPLASSMHKTRAGWVRCSLSGCASAEWEVWTIRSACTESRLLKGYGGGTDSVCCRLCSQAAWGWILAQPLKATYLTSLWLSFHICNLE